LNDAKHSVTLNDGAQERSADAAARAAIEQRLGHRFDNDAWKRTRQRLIEFVLTLQRWDEQRKSASEDKNECNKPAA
jgi:hypothetical protein